MQQPKKHMAEDLFTRFRSKEDLFRYIIQQGKARLLILTFS